MATMKKVSLDVSEDTIRDLDGIAQVDGVSRSDVIRWAMRDYIFLRHNTLESKKLYNVRQEAPTDHTPDRQLVAGQ